MSDSKKISQHQFQLFVCLLITLLVLILSLFLLNFQSKKETWVRSILHRDSPSFPSNDHRIWKQNQSIIHQFSFSLFRTNISCLRCWFLCFFTLCRLASKLDGRPWGGGGISTSVETLTRQSYGNPLNVINRFVFRVLIVDLTISFDSSSIVTRNLP